MKRNLFFVLAFTLILAGCKNYDDQFNDLNSQISALATQVSGLSKVQSDLASLAGTVSSLQTSISSLPTTADLASATQGLQALSEKVEALQAQLDTVASSEDLDKVNNSLDGVKDDLDDLLKSSNVFNGDLNINSGATLEFAESLQSKVAIINGDVKISITSDMDIAKLQAVTGQIKTITKNLYIRAKSGSIATVTLDSLTGVGDLSVTLPERVYFPMLKSVGKVTLGSNYQSKLTGDVDFSALEQVTSFTTAVVAEDFTTSNAQNNTISLSKIAALKLNKLPYYSPGSLTINTNKNTVIELDALQSVDASGKKKAHGFTIDGALDFSVSGLVDGSVSVTNVKNVTLEAFQGSIAVNEGVENVTVGALKNDFKPKAGNDLETVKLTMDAAAKTVDLTDAKGLTTLSISGKVKTVTLKNNDDLTNFTLDAAIEGLTIENSNLSTADLAYTNANLEKGASLTLKGNTDLTSFKADNVNGLQTLTITGNSDLENLSFDALKAVPTDAAAAPVVTIGGSAADANAFNATAITQNGVNGKTGSFSSDSGLDDLKAYLAAAAKNAKAKLKVYFDSADDFSDGTNTQSNLKIATAADVARLVVINAEGNASDAVKGKRAFLITTRGNTTITANNSTLPIVNHVPATATAADLTAGITSAANVTQMKNNGVTLTANTNGSPKGTITSTAARMAAVSSALVSNTANTKVTLTIGSYKQTLNLVTVATTDFTATTMTSKKEGIDEYVVAAGTTVQSVTAALAAKYATSPYTVVANTAAALSTIDISAKDRSNAHHGKKVAFSVNKELTGFGKFTVNNSTTTTDDTLIGKDVLVILESTAAGILSNVGTPITSAGTAGATAGNTTAAVRDAGITVAAGAVVELYNSKATTAAADESRSVAAHGKDATSASKSTNRLDWLAG